MVVPALRLDEQAVQAEHAGVVALRHLLEGRRRGGAVAGELRRLRAQEQRERLARRDAARLVGEFLRRARVAGADRDQPVRHRAIAAHAAAVAQVLREQIGRAQQRAHDRPGQHGGDRDRRHRGDQHHDRGLDALALPGDDDVAGAVGEPDRAEGEERDDDEIDDDADHGAMGLMTELRTR